MRLGRGIRALRLRAGFRQIDLARQSRVSDTVISRIERGYGDRVTGRTLEGVAGALGARLVVRLDWQGEALDRLLDAGHAELVAVVMGRLRAAGWEAEPEATFSIGAERGSIDVLAWHPPSASLLIVEVKSVVPDIQAMLSSLDRKVRLAPAIVAPRGWRPRMVARLLAIGDTRTSRRRVAAHRAIFDARFPERFVEVRRFVTQPATFDGLDAIWFLPLRAGATARHRAGARLRAGRA